MPNQNANLRSGYPGAFAFLALALVLAGCKGLAVKGEREAREQIQAVGQTYRPLGFHPDLPSLGTNSPLEDYLKFALLNEPKVEAAYYDWLASVERITVQRSLPDPQLTFQMDIQDVVTSLMPGLMMNFPGAGKLRAAGAVAAADSQGKYFAFKAASLESAYELKRSYYRLYFLEEKIRVERETLSLLSELEKLARDQNEVGKVTLQDVLRAQIEQDRLRVELANLEDSRAPLLASFRAALGLRAEQPTPPLPNRFESTALGSQYGQAFGNGTSTQYAVEGNGSRRAVRRGRYPTGLSCAHAGCEHWGHGGCKDESGVVPALGHCHASDLAR